MIYPSRRVVLGLVLGAAFAPGAAAECDTNMRSSIDAGRYQITSNNTATDTTTGLAWQRCPVGYSWTSEETCAATEGAQTTFTWSEALQYAESTGSGWRMPNSKELESLVKRNCWTPALAHDVFSALELGYMWTSTPASAYFGNAWAIQFVDGGVVSVDKEGAYAIRLVKDAR